MHLLTLSRLLTNFSILAVGFVLAFAIQPARADCASYEVHCILATDVPDFARYYAPYAIQAAATYLPVQSLDEHRNADIEEYADNPELRRNYGSDVSFVVESLFPENQTQEKLIHDHAIRAFQKWRYLFGSDAYLGCYDPNDGECKKALSQRSWFALPDGPSFQVWGRSRLPHALHDVCTEISIAFRGTNNWSDWASNLDWLTGSQVDDSYAQVRRNIDAIVRKITQQDCYRRARERPQIVSVGHSLGGGLAQLAALAVSRPPRIAKVFAFDSTPVTGANLVDAKTLRDNVTGLTIDRIRQNGEVLSKYLRRLQQYPHSSSTCNPRVLTVDLEGSRGTSIQLHSMAELAGDFVRSSYDVGTQSIARPLEFPEVSACEPAPRYRYPSTDEDDKPLPTPVVISERFDQAFKVSSIEFHPRRYYVEKGISRRTRHFVRSQPRFDGRWAGRERLTTLAYQ